MERLRGCIVEQGRVEGMNGKLIVTRDEANGSIDSTRIAAIIAEALG